MHLQFCVSSQHPVCSSPLERPIQQSEPWTRFCTQRVAGKTRGMQRTHIRDLKQPRVPLKRVRERDARVRVRYIDTAISVRQYIVVIERHAISTNSTGRTTRLPTLCLNVKWEFHSRIARRNRDGRKSLSSTLPGTLPSTHQHWLGTPTKVLIALLSNWVIALQFTSNSHLVLPRLQSLFALHPPSKVLTQHLFSDFYVRN